MRLNYSALPVHMPMGLYTAKDHQTAQVCHNTVTANPYRTGSQYLTWAAVRAKTFDAWQPMERQPIIVRVPTWSQYFVIGNLRKYAHAQFAHLLLKHIFNIHPLQ